MAAAAFFLRKTSGIFLLNKFLAQNRRTGAKSATVAEFEFETETFSQHSIFQILWSCLSVCLSASLYDLLYGERVPLSYLLWQFFSNQSLNLVINNFLN